MSNAENNVWSRFKRNKTGLLGLVFILICTLISIFSYIIAPDSSENANQQTLEFRLKEPGFKGQFLKVAKNNRVKDKNFFSRILTGKKSKYDWIPIESYQIESPFIIVQQYQSEVKKYHFLDVLEGLGNNNVKPSKSGYHYTDIDGNPKNFVLFKSIEASLAKNIVTRTYLLGADDLGRDIFSRILIGTRISLSIGALAVLISLSIGILLGALAGYYGGKLDDFIMLLINTVWSIPILLFVFAIIIVMDRGFFQICLAVGLTMWVDVARIVRGQVIALKNNSFIEATKSFGYNDVRVILYHLLPNIIGPIVVIASANFAAAILIEAGLSYLGFGVQPPIPSWGNILEENHARLLFGSNPIIALSPALAIMFLVLSFNLVGNALRDAFDVKLSNTNR